MITPGFLQASVSNSVSNRLKKYFDIAVYRLLSLSADTKLTRLRYDVFGPNYPRKLLHFRPCTLSTRSYLSKRPNVSVPIGSNPCEHAGKCINTMGSFQCHCQRGYVGARCELDINECMSNPCLNEATCLDRIGEFSCICMPGKFTK